MDKDGGNQTNVTNRSGDDTSPIWSPDGADIALVYQSSIWLIAPDGSNVRNLNGVSSTFYGEPNWSYDSNQIFFVKSPTAGSEIYVMNRTGANQHSIDTSIELDNQPTPSPDGTKVAWVSNRDGNAEIYVSNIDGTQPTRVTNNDTKDTFPRWRPCAH
jgi:Tol biopolymer transport system component